MGMVPNRHPIYMNEISAALGGENNLGYYRGRTYYRGGGAVVISQSPSMAEFPGLQTAAPIAWQACAYVDASVDIELRIGYRPRTGELWVTYQAVGNDFPYTLTPMVTFNPADYTTINCGAQWAGGDGAIGVTLIKGITPGLPDDYMELSMTHAPSGAQFGAAHFYVSAS